jgi:hypothetical protein
VLARQILVHAQDKDNPGCAFPAIAHALALGALHEVPVYPRGRPVPVFDIFLHMFFLRNAPKKLRGEIQTRFFMSPEPRWICFGFFYFLFVFLYFPLLLVTKRTKAKNMKSNERKN